MRRGLKFQRHDGDLEAMQRHRRFPDEEGTEMIQSLPARQLRPQGHRRFPDEEGTEISISACSSAVVQQVTEDSPMRRGLKCQPRSHLAAPNSGHRRFPDEEGTEMSAPLTLSCTQFRSQKIPR